MISGLIILYRLRNWATILNFEQREDLIEIQTWFLNEKSYWPENFQNDKFLGSLFSSVFYIMKRKNQARVVQTLDSAIERIIKYWRN